MFDRISGRVRAWDRAFRLSWHIATGVVTVAVLFPYMKPRDRDGVISQWSFDCLRLLHVQIRVTGDVPPRHASSILIVANHISWLDILAVSAVKRVRFVAKSEVRSWPVIGWLAARTGTIFLARHRPRQLMRTNRSIHAALTRGHCVAVFPEGTTSDGRSVLSFHSGLLEPAVTSQSLVWPAALRYRTSDGRPTDCAAFVGERSLVSSIWQVMTQPTLLLDLHFASPVEGSRHDRQALSDLTRSSISSTLTSMAQSPFTNPPDSDPAPDWSGEPSTTA